MTIYFSRSVGGFLDSDLHIDLPADAIKITPEERDALLAGQSAGMRIAADDDGHPMCVPPPEPTERETILAEIVALEATITARRLRESILGIDSGWLTTINEQISALRARLL